MAEKETRKRTKNLTFNSKNTASGSKQYYFPEYLVFFLKKQPTKKTKNRGEKLEKLLPLYLVYVSHQGCNGQPRTNWRRGLLQKAVTTRDRCVVRMCASPVLSRRATSPEPVQRKNCAILQSHPDGTTKKKNLVFRTSPNRGGILTSSKKNRKKNDFLHSYEYAS